MELGPFDGGEDIEVNGFGFIDLPYGWHRAKLFDIVFTSPQRSLGKRYTTHPGIGVSIGVGISIGVGVSIGIGIHPCIKVLH